ncbi:MAG: hypothetical protein HKN27_05780 [Silicimonas sp.]|nr:hypothetical protein [Silicimonas sp.]
MTDRKEQIEMLNDAKADVQKQLDAIFVEEGEIVIASVCCLSEIDPDRMAQFLAKTIYAHFNSQEEAIRSNIIESFSSAFGSMAEDVLPNGGTSWDDEDAQSTPQDEAQAATQAA